MKINNSSQSFVTLHNTLCFGGILFMLFFVVLNKTGFTFDEPYYLDNVALFEQYRLSDAFLEKLAGPAGPTYAIVHWLLKPITGLQVVPVRLVNVILLIGSIAFIFLTLKKLNSDNAFPKSLAIMCMPMVFVCSAMALTEVPALFFLSAAVYLLLVAVQNNSVLPAIVGGIFMSFAILGRQPYLLVLGALPILLYKKHTDLKRWVVLGLFFLFAVVLPLYAFKVWGGLVPHKGGDTATEHGLSPLNFFLSLGFGFMITLFLAPAWLIRIRKKEALILLVTLMLATVICVMAGFTFPVMNTVSKKVLPAALLKYYGAFMGALLVTLGLYFVASAFFRARLLLNNPTKLFYLVACLFILVSTLKITHQFSSRYVFQAAPFFIFFLSDYINFKVSDIGLRTVAVVMGVVSLLSYF